MINENAEQYYKLVKYLDPIAAHAPYILKTDLYKSSFDKILSTAKATQIHKIALVVIKRFLNRKLLQQGLEFIKKNKRRQEKLKLGF